MPKRTDLQKILIIGSGPIIIGQACEFDYSGTQACKALREEGFEVVLVNSNPATIMTDPDMAQRVYLEPLSAESVERIIERERPQALLPTLGGQTGLNLALELADRGILSRFNVEIIGAKKRAIERAEDRDLFRESMAAAGLETPASGYAATVRDAHRIADRIGFPLIVRPSLTLGGTGAGIAYSRDELDRVMEHALATSPRNEALVEQSVIGWKEYELEVMRDGADNVVVVCSIENFDPMGIHTGDSITVAPAQTLTDREYQLMRDASAKVIRAIGVETGGSNIQFAVNPADGHMLVIEMNPRVSRSSALASKATGFPIAKIAAKLAVGYTLNELPNDITRETPASFEPTLDYTVVKIPRWAFEKFPGVDRRLFAQMKSVGEVMAIGRTFPEALQKAVRSLETGLHGLSGNNGEMLSGLSEAEILERVAKPLPERLLLVYEALKRGIAPERIGEATKIDPWFLDQMRLIADVERHLTRPNGNGQRRRLTREVIWEAKQRGFGDAQLGHLLGRTEKEVRRLRIRQGVTPVHKLVDTCAAEFEAYTPYYYSTYEKPFLRLEDGVWKSTVQDEARVSSKRKILIVGAGPNRIGQGIEFDYCCVHAALGLRDDGFETIMVNSNPETVSTDYDTSDKLYFEPLTFEDVMNIIEKEKPEGVIVQFGGQTSLNLAVPLQKAGAPIIGTSPDSIDRAEDRDRFRRVVDKLGLVQAPNAVATSAQEALAAVRDMGFPVMVRPSYVLGGRAMEVVYDEPSLVNYLSEAVRASPDRPVLVDKFLEGAIEIDVDAIADGELVVIGGIMEHIEEAGVHSGDSACVLPPYSLVEDQLDLVREQTCRIAKELSVIGLMNIQFAMKNDVLYVLEVNPRASRTIPFISKAIGVPLAKLAARVMAGKTLKELGFTEEARMEHTAVKCPVFPFTMLPGSEPVLGPEMKSTGEVMGIDVDFGRAFAKAYGAAGHRIPTTGTVFLSVRNDDKRYIIFIARALRDMGFRIVATQGTAGVLRRNGIVAQVVHRVYEATPNVLDLIDRRQVNLIITTPSGQAPREDQMRIRRAAVENHVTLVTTISGAMAAVAAIECVRRGEFSTAALSDYYAGLHLAAGEN